MRLGACNGAKDHPTRHGRCLFIRGGQGLIEPSFGMIKPGRDFHAPECLLVAAARRCHVRINAHFASEYRYVIDLP